MHRKFARLLRRRTGLKTQASRQRNHRAVIGTKLKFRVIDAEAFAFCLFIEGRPQLPVGAYTTGHDQLLEAGLLHRFQRLPDQNLDDGLLKGACRICPEFFRHGGTYKGPTPRSHAHDLPKKFRALGLRHALSAKAGAGQLIILDSLDMAEAKTRILAKAAKELGWKRVLIIDGAEVNENFARAAANIEGIDVLPSMGANVYDILKRDTLVLTKAGVEALEARLGKGDLK